MPLGSELKAAREAIGLTQGELATAVEITQSYLSQLENGHRKTVPPGLTVKLAARLGLPRDAFSRYVSRQGKSAADKVASYRELGTVHAGAGLDDPPDPNSWVSLPVLCEGADGVYRVRGDSMRLAGIHNGDLLIVRQTDIPDDDDIVVAHLEDRGCVVKKAKISESPVLGRQIVLHCEGDDKDRRYPHRMTDRDKIYGVVLAVFRSYRRGSRMVNTNRLNGGGRRKR